MTSTRAFIPILLSVIIVLSVCGAAADETVGNIRWYRASDDKLVIYYDLMGTAPLTISIQASFDGGSDYSIVPKTLYGDVGDSIQPGRFKRIVWDLAADGIDSSADITVRVSAGETGQRSIQDSVRFSHGERPRLDAVRIDSPVKLDGFLTEPFWMNTEPATGFTQRELSEGDPATERTEVRIVYDDDNVYIGVICFDSNPGAIIRNEMQRDVDLKSDDNFTVVIDTFNSLRNGYFFQINPNGARFDGFFYGTELLNEDWDGIWDVSARITDKGWSAEIMIPFKTLRFPASENQVWGVNFRRLIRRKSEEVLWSSWRRDDGLYQLSRAGELYGIREVRKGRKAEFIPFVLGGAEERNGDEDTDFKYGLDIRYPITSDLTLDITTHTDFAQVETDKEQINLTRFSLFYPEKREFFLEGAEIYDFDTGYFEKVYHSRRIGISPDREQIPILGGVNLAGRTGPYSIGVMNIQTDKKGDIPGTNYSVVRFKRDILERSRIGFIATNLYDSDEHDNRTLGADFFYQTNRLMGNKNFGIRGDVTGSFTDGEHKDALFGRVFIDYPNDLIDSFAEFYHVGENFNPEVGFITRNGIRRANGKIRFFPRPPIPCVNRLVFMPLGLNYISDTDGLMLERTLSWWPFGIITTTDDQFTFIIETFYDYVDEDFSIFEGTVISADKYEWSSWGVELESNTSRPVSLSVTAKRGGFYDGDRDVYNPGLTLKLSRHLSLTSDVLYNDITLGGEHFITREYGSKINLNLSTKLTTGTFVQYNNETSEVNMNFRLHYLPNIGSDLYIVYNHLWDESRDYATKYRTAILKVDYLIRF